MVSEQETETEAEKKKNKRGKRKKNSPAIDEREISRQRLETTGGGPITQYGLYTSNMASGGCSQAGMWPSQQYPQYPQPMMPNYMTSSQNDQVLSQILKRLDSIESSLGKLTKIEASVNLMTYKLDCVENRVKDTESKMSNLEDSVKFASDQYDSVQTDLKNLTASINDKLEPEVKRMTSQVRDTTSQVEGLQRQNKELREALNEQQYRSMRDNLIFSGIKEEDKEETQEVLNAFIHEKLKIEEILSFERVHRLGPPTGAGAKPRNIIAKFTYYKQREQVRMAAPKLKGLAFGINEQFPKDVMETRKQLIPLFREAKRKRQKAKLVMDKLYIEGVRVYPEDMRDERREGSSGWTSGRGSPRAAVASGQHHGGQQAAGQSPNRDS